MTFVVQGTVEIDGAAAEAEVKSLGNAVRQTSTQAGDFAGKGRAAAAAATALGQQNRFAAGNVANLTAQFNDIGVMLAAGQNPLQLALQQGTQITQVLGPLGAAGSVKALGAAFVSLISPVTLLTLGVIAGVAALGQWAIGALSASDNASELEERLLAVRDAQAALNLELRQVALGVSANELTLLDQIATKNREITALQDDLADANTRVARGLRAQIAAASEVRDGLQEELAALREATAERERLTAEVRATADAERLVGENLGKTASELAEAEQIAELLRAGIQASVIQAMQLAGVDMSSPISAAARDAALLASNLGIAYSTALSLQTFNARNPISPAQQDEDALFSQPVLSTAATRAGQRDALANFGRIIAPSAGGGGGGGASAINQEQRAIDDLIRSLREQRDILRETDPVQKEMIQNREVLAAATAAERDQVEELIASRIREQEAIDLATERAQFYGDITRSVLQGAIEDGNDLDDVLKKVAGSFLDAAIQAALFGEGPFGSFFGGVSLFGGGSPQTLSDGGIVYGPGGSRDDRVPAALSPGEFVVNASATARNRALLEAINAGAPALRLANGGAVPGGAALAPGAPVPVTIVIDLSSARGNQEIMESAREGVQVALEEFSREVLPGRVAEINDNPRMIG